MKPKIISGVKRVGSGGVKRVKSASIYAYKKKKQIIAFIIIGLVLFWLGGFLTGWWWAQGKLSDFQTVDANTKLLVLSPHPDDEVLMSGGLIQDVMAKDGQVKIIYLTTGDSSIGSVIRIDRNLKLSPSEFIDLGEKRRNEAVIAMKTLGVSSDKLAFLAFPDQGLNEVLGRDDTDSRGPVISRSTKLDHVAYSWAYKEGQSFYRQELLEDIKNIIQDFKPTVIVTTHPRDSHPDHRAAAEIVEIIESEMSKSWQTYYCVIHYRNYPDRGNYLFPPRKLFNNNWVSFNVNDSERSFKREAILDYSSQAGNMLDRGWYLRFDSRNEIFEKD